MAMKARLFRVVTFAADPAHGNPAFVLTEADGAGDRTLTAARAMLGADIIARGGNADRRGNTAEVLHSGGAAVANLTTTEIVLQQKKEEGPRARSGCRQ